MSHGAQAKRLIERPQSNGNQPHAMVMSLFYLHLIIVFMRKSITASIYEEKPPAYVEENFIT
ncbi:hypothetical protein [Lysinibacillus sp. G4S2]|uniref:hypothetical protein n=1 Tax=Lysinibacillus sp. G4S2 TaxID=3055859 RepID=UPI0025A1AB94|nr:hypothetical protein [Lysinibacillus sp. G4S2]MDM5247190.1 hypothetical protein [Lysinibacillus sp. G4S2]